MSTTATVGLLYYAWMDSPVGRVLFEGDAGGLGRLDIDTPQKPRTPSEGAVEDASLFREAMAQLKAYFAGELQAFDLKLNPAGTDFQRRAWRELQRIPYGETISYGEQAKRMGDAKACRATGAANGQNPISIVIPCHRVIGSTGKLTGFGSGLPIKQWLLQHESGLFKPATY